MEVAEFPLVASVDSADVLAVNVSVGVAEVEILVDEAVDDAELAGDEVSVEVGDVGKLVEEARKLVEVARLDTSVGGPFDGTSEGGPFEGTSVGGPCDGTSEGGPWSVSVAVGVAVELAVVEESIKLCMNC